MSDDAKPYAVTELGSVSVETSYSSREVSSLRLRATVEALESERAELQKTREERDTYQRAVTAKVADLGPLLAEVAELRAELEKTRAALEELEALREWKALHKTLSHDLCPECVRDDMHALRAEFEKTKAALEEAEGKLAALWVPFSLREGLISPEDFKKRAEEFIAGLQEQRDTWAARAEKAEARAADACPEVDGERVHAGGSLACGQCYRSLEAALKSAEADNAALRNWVRTLHSNATGAELEAMEAALASPSPGGRRTPPGWCPNCNEQPYNIRGGVCGWCGKNVPSLGGKE